MSDLYIGLMSGTSMDGIDVAIVDFSKILPRVIDFQTVPYPNTLLQWLNALCSPAEDEIVNMGRTDRALGQAFAQAVNQILVSNNLSAKDIVAIGSHGQTIRHHPEGRQGFSLQIGDGNTLSVLTGIDVIADFRRKDIALGGQGAPLVPAFHHAVFSDHLHNRVILNIGGISNITYLPANNEDSVLGFDTGPGNTLMDAWCKLHTGMAYDKSGAWAAQGKHCPKLLALLLEQPFINEPAPKSTGRELFNLTWLQTQLKQINMDLSPQTVQATLAMFTSQSIAQHIHQLKDVSQVFVCGGGARNDFLMECLSSELFDCELSTTDEIGISADSLEAVAFAWLAYAFKNKLKGNLPSVTGASQPAVLGCLYPAD